MLSAATLLGYGQKTGIFLPNESKGKLPSDLDTNKTGVYTTAIGQHTLLATPLQASIALSGLVTGEIGTPRIVRMAIGPEVSLQKAINSSKKMPYDRLMKTININKPLWVVDDAEVSKAHLFITSKNKQRVVPLTNKEREILFDGMNAVCRRMSHDKRLHTYFHSRPDIFKVFEEEQPFMIGKSSTAQLYERFGLALGQKPAMYNHVWFGGIFFKEPSQQERKAALFKNAELIVIVFLRYGAHGKDAAPLATAVAREWKNIQKRHEPAKIK
jgi:cell division protein FtsI/penicillin-binding protein 2